MCRWIDNRVVYGCEGCEINSDLASVNGSLNTINNNLSSLPVVPYTHTHTGMTQFDTGGLQRNGRIVIGRIGGICNTDWGDWLIETQIDIGYISTYTPTRMIVVPIYKTNNYTYGGILQIIPNGQVSIFITQAQIAKNGFVSAEFTYFTNN